MRRQKLQKDKGITLIALIITIIILLILAIVSIKLVMNAGLIIKTEYAVDKYTDEEIKEKIELAYSEYKMKKILDPNYTLEEALENAGIEGTVTGDIENGYQITVPTSKGDKVVNIAPDGNVSLGSTATGGTSDTWVDNGNGSYTKGEVTITIGDYVDYTYDSATNYSLSSTYVGNTNNSTSGIPQTTSLKWRILNVDTQTGNIDIISETPTNNTVCFSGSLGYNNAVFFLNDICAKQYSNSNLGLTARSINIEDIEKQMNSTGIAARNNTTNSHVDTGLYGGKSLTTYTGTNNYYPSIYAQQIGAGINTTELKTAGIGESDSYYSTPTTSKSGRASTSGLTVKQTYYTFSDTPSSYFSNSLVHSMIFGTGSNYWLASRFTNCSSSKVYFGLRRVYNANLNGYYMYSSSNADQGSEVSHNIRPVVSLGNNIQLGATGGGESNPRSLTKISQ